MWWVDVKFHISLFFVCQQLSFVVPRELSFDNVWDNMLLNIVCFEPKIALKRAEKIKKSFYNFKNFLDVRYDIVEFKTIIDIKFSLFYLHPSDDPVSVFVSSPWPGKSYETWSKVMGMALSTKNKIVFVERLANSYFKF